MPSALKISDAANLAIHAVTVIAKTQAEGPVKLSRLAELLRASESHLGKVMHRLALAKVVTSKRGPNGGFVLGPAAEQMTLLELYEMIDGPLGRDHCLLEFDACPYGGCVLGDAIERVNEHIRSVLGEKRLSELAG